MEKFVMAGAHPCHVFDSEEGAPTLVLLHGYLASLATWEPWIEIAQQHFRVVAPDLPGHGISPVVGECHTMSFLAHFVRDLLDKLAIERCILVGHSMGGYVALAFAELFPERLAGVVLFHSTPNADSEAKRADRAREITLIEQGKLEMLATLTAPKGFAPANRERLEEEIAHFEEQATMHEEEGIAALLRGMMERKDQHKMLQQLKCPQLFIFGREDEYITPEIAETIIERHPQAEVTWLEASGHMGFLEEPEAALEAIRAFAERID